MVVEPPSHCQTPGPGGVLTQTALACLLHMMSQHALFPGIDCTLAPALHFLQPSCRAMFCLHEIAPKSRVADTMPIAGTLSLQQLRSSQTADAETESALLLQVGTPLTHKHFLRRHRGTYGGSGCQQNRSNRSRHALAARQHSVQADSGQLTTHACCGPWA